jgi:hypothetical protein
LEDLHGGTSPSSGTGDFSDVVVNSPYGTILWPKVSRLNDDEMKQLMIDVVNRTYEFVCYSTKPQAVRLFFSLQNVIPFLTGRHRV